MVDLQRSVALLRALARGLLLSDAAEEADLDLDQAQGILNDMAERLDIQAKKFAKEHSEQQEKIAAAKRRADDPDSLVLAFDGGSRGNPGPAAGAAVAIDGDGSVLAERWQYFEKETNNFAEYQGLLCAVELAAQLGVRRLRLQGDSELIVKQINGEYKVKNKGLLRLFIEVNNNLRDFEQWRIRYVPREENELADALVNRVLDEKAPKKKRKKPQKR